MTVSFLRATDEPILATPAVVDMKTQSVDIACRLGSLHHFLKAAHELQTCRRLCATEFKRHSRKVVSLIEIARKTLVAAGVLLYLFHTPPKAFSSYKFAYVALLELLDERTSDIDPILYDRVTSLLTPLSSGFVIQRKGEAMRPVRLPFLPTSTRAPDASARPNTSSPPSQPSTSSISDHYSPMAPPDAFPVVFLPGRARTKRGRSDAPVQIWDPEMYRSPRRRRTQGPEIDQENMIPPPRLVRPLPRRFGIFCTGKSSMHEPQERVGRSRTTRPLTKE